MSGLRYSLPRSRAARLAWLWCLAVLLCLKSAVPLLAAAAADQRGVSLAQVCTVYGVRTAVLSSAASPDAAAHDAAGHSTDPGADHAAPEHCALASLPGGVLPASWPAVLAHAPPQALLAAVPARAALPADAALRWLSARLHAPPARG